MSKRNDIDFDIMNKQTLTNTSSPTTILESNIELDNYISDSKAITTEKNNNSNVNDSVDLTLPDEILNKEFLFDNIFKPNNNEQQPDNKGQDADIIPMLDFPKFFGAENLINTIPETSIIPFDTKNKTIDKKYIVVGISFSIIILYFMTRG